MAIPASHIELKMDDEAIADDHLYDMRVPIFSFGSFFSRELCLRSMNRTLSRYNKCLDSSETALVEHEEEELLEAANALKKQMWAEVQLDKRRMKEEYVMKMQYPSYISDKTEPNVQISSAEGRQSPLPTVDDKNGLVSTNPVEQKEHLHDAQNDQNYPIHMPTERNPPIQEASTCTDNLSLLQPGYAAERSRSQLKAYIGHKAEEMYVYRSLPLGQDRRRNRYWQFITSSSRNDPGSGRIFVKLRHGCWRLIDSEEGNSDIDQLGKIFAAFGTPKPSQWPDIKYLPDYVEYQYVPGQPLRQLFPMASADALDLLSKMFTYDPKARISALQALEHRTSWCSLNSI